MKTRSDSNSGYHVTYRGRCTPITSAGIAGSRAEDYTGRTQSESKRVQRFGVRILNLGSMYVIQWVRECNSIR